MKRFKYFVLTGIIITCIAGCQNNYSVTIPVDDNIVEDNNDLGNASIGVADDNQQDTTAEILYDAETIRKILAYKYSYEPPFHLDFSHEDENGCYVYHFYEVVINEDESHTATADRFTVDPKTGETTTF